MPYLRNNEVRKLVRAIDGLSIIVYLTYYRSVKMSKELDRLTVEVSETSTAVDSAIALIEGLAERIRDLADDPVALNALADELDTKTNALAAAVAANTTEEPPVEPEV